MLEIIKTFGTRFRSASWPELRDGRDLDASCTRAYLCNIVETDRMHLTRRGSARRAQIAPLRTNPTDMSRNRACSIFNGRRQCLP